MNEQAIEVRVQQELQKIISDPRALILYAAQALKDADNKILAIQNHVKTDLMPKVEMWDVAMGSDQLFEMSAVAKILNFRNMGRNNLFEYLKAKKILRYNKEPYQQYVDNKCFKIIEQSFDAGNGIQIYRKTMATQRGIDYIGKLLLGDGYERNAR
jgi:anti-repressor protein